METIRNLLSPNKDKSDAQPDSTYGTGGQGSHFNEARTGPTGVEGSQTSSHVPGGFPSETSTADNSSSGLGHNNPLGTNENNLAGHNASRTTPGIGQGAGLAGSSNTSTSGPHSSNLANKADPRVDSDNSRLGGSGSTGVGHSNPQSNLTGREALGTTPGVSHGTGLAGSSNTTTSGPHSSNIANKADPRVDSDNSKLTGSGLTGSHTSAGEGSRPIGDNTGSAILGGTSTARSFPLGGSSHSATSGPHTSSTTSGPHTSNLANQADPRVDSDNSQLGRTGHASSNTGSGYTGNTGHDTSTTSGPHTSNLANKADPRVDSDNSGVGGTGTGYGTSGTGTGLTGSTGHNTSTTSGPHTSNLANKADPRVDSDNSKVGGTGLTGASSNTGTGHNLERDGALASTGAVLGSTADRGHHGDSGPHQTRTANLLDPKIGGGSSGQEGATKHHGHGGSRVGGGAEEADRHHGDIGTTSADATKVRDTNLVHGSNLGNSGTTGSSHTGRDSAVGAGLGSGAAGLAAHEHNKHETQPSSGLGHHETAPRSGSSAANIGHSGHNPTTNVGGGRLPHDTPPEKEGIMQKLKSKLLPGHKDEHSNNTTTGAVDPATSTSHQYGRDAAVAGGAAGVGGAAHEHESAKDLQKDQKQEEKELKKEHKHEIKEEKKHEKAFEKEQKQEVKAEKKDEKVHHTDQKNAIKEEKKEEKAIHKHQMHDVKAEKKDEKAAIKEEKREEKDAHKHQGAATGASAAVGTGAYETERHHGTDTNRPLPTASSQQHNSSTEHRDIIGDHLHGDRNRGVTGSSGFPGTEGYGDKHIPQGSHNSGFAENSGHARTGGYENQTIPQGSQSGVVGGSELTGTEGYRDQHSGITGNSGHQGKEGYWGDQTIPEISDHRNMTGNSGLPDSEHYGDQNTSHGSHLGEHSTVASGNDGRNRLHKEPPATHPAAHASHGTTGNLEGNSGVSNTGGNQY